MFDENSLLCTVIILCCLLLQEETTKKNKEGYKLTYFSAKWGDKSVFLQGKCGECDFEMDISFENFPTEKARDEAYKVWVESYLKAFKNGKLMIK